MAKISKCPSSELSDSRLPTYCYLNDVFSFLNNLENDYQTWLKYVGEENKAMWKRGRALVNKIKSKLKQYNDIKIQNVNASTMTSTEFVSNICDTNNEFVYSVAFAESVRSPLQLQLAPPKEYFLKTDDVTPLAKPSYPEEEVENRICPSGKKRKAASSSPVRRSAQMVKQLKGDRYILEERENKRRKVSVSSESEKRHKRFAGTAKEEASEVKNSEMKHCLPTVRLERLQFDSMNIKRHYSVRNWKTYSFPKMTPIVMNKTECKISSSIQTKENHFQRGRKRKQTRPTEARRSERNVKLAGSSPKQLKGHKYVLEELPDKRRSISITSDPAHECHKNIAGIVKEETNEINNNIKILRPVVKLERIQFDSVEVKNLVSIEKWKMLRSRTIVPMILNKTECTVSYEGQGEESHKNVSGIAVGEASETENSETKTIHPTVKSDRLEFDSVEVSFEKWKTLSCTNSEPVVVNKTKTECTVSCKGQSKENHRNFVGITNEGARAIENSRVKNLPAVKLERLLFDSVKVESNFSVKKRKIISSSYSVPVIVNKIECTINSKDLDIITGETGRPLTRPGMTNNHPMTRRSRMNSHDDKGQRNERTPPNLQSLDSKNLKKPLSPPSSTNGTKELNMSQLKDCRVQLSKLDTGFRGFESAGGSDHRYEVVHDLLIKRMSIEQSNKAGRETTKNSANIDTTEKLPQKCDSQTAYFPLRNIKESTVSPKSSTKSLLRRSVRIFWGKRNGSVKSLWSSLCCRVPRMPLAPRKISQRSKVLHPCRIRKNNILSSSSSMVFNTNHSHDVNEYFSKAILYSMAKDWKGTPDWVQGPAVIKAAIMQSFIPIEVKCNFITSSDTKPVVDDVFNERGD